MPALDRLATRQWHLGIAASTGKSGQALSSAYVFGVSGNAVAIRFVAPVSATLTDVYLFCSALTGAPGNLTVELRSFSSATVPGSTLHASATVASPGAANRWIRATFGTPFSCVAGTTYYIVVADPAGSAGNNVTVAWRGAVLTLERHYELLGTLTSSNGFSSGSLTTAMCGVLKFGDGSLWGMPYTNASNGASSAVERGLKITGLTAPLSLSGLIVSQAITQWTGIKIYAGNTAPGGSPAHTISVSASAAAVGATYFASVTLQANTVYRIVLTFSGAIAAPGYIEIEDHTSFADLVSAGMGAGTMHYTLDNGAGGWTDETQRLPRISLILADVVAGGGGGPVVGSRIVQGVR